MRKDTSLDEKELRKKIKEGEQERKQKRLKEREEEKKKRDKEETQELLKDSLDSWLLLNCFVALVFVSMPIGEHDYMSAVTVAVCNLLFIAFMMQRSWMDFVMMILFNICLVMLAPYIRFAHRVPTLLPWTSWFLVLYFNATVIFFLVMTLVRGKSEDYREFYINVACFAWLVLNAVFLPACGVVSSAVILRYFNNLKNAIFHLTLNG